MGPGCPAKDRALYPKAQLEFSQACLGTSVTVEGN